MKTISQTSSNQVQQETLTDFNGFKTRIFEQKGNEIYIGGVLVTDQMRGVLRDQAKNFQTSNLYEIIDATISNEAADLALIQSGKSGNIEDDVRSAKMLHHWNHVMKNIIYSLSK